MYGGLPYPPVEAFRSSFLIFSTALSLQAFSVFVLLPAGREFSFHCCSSLRKFFSRTSFDAKTMFSTSVDDSCSNATRYSCSLSVCSYCKKPDIFFAWRFSITAILQKIWARAKATAAAKYNLHRTTEPDTARSTSTTLAVKIKADAAAAERMDLSQIQRRCIPVEQKVLRWLDLYIG